MYTFYINETAYKNLMWSDVKKKLKFKDSLGEISSETYYTFTLTHEQRVNSLWVRDVSSQKKALSIDALRALNVQPKLFQIGNRIGGFCFRDDYRKLPALTTTDVQYMIKNEDSQAFIEHPVGYYVLSDRHGQNILRHPSREILSAVYIFYNKDTDEFRLDAHINGNVFENFLADLDDPYLCKGNIEDLFERLIEILKNKSNTWEVNLKII